MREAEVPFTRSSQALLSPSGRTGPDRGTTKPREPQALCQHGAAVALGRLLRRRQAPLDGRFRLFDTVTRPARLVLCVSRDGREKTMETILIIVVLLFLFGGGGYYWNSRRG